MSWQVRVISAVAGILKKNDKILVAERPLGKPYSGYWEFPGGKIEANETGFNALVRELREELDIEVRQAEFCFEHRHAYPDKIVHLQIFLVTSFHGEPVNKEHQQLRWVTFSEMQELKLLEGNWGILERLGRI